MKRDPNTSRETYERDQCVWKETYLKRPIYTIDLKETYKMKRDPNKSRETYGRDQCMWKENNVYEKRHN